MKRLFGNLLKRDRGDARRVSESSVETLPLSPRAGEIYAHIHENSHTGLRRALFWNLNVELDPVEWDAETWDASLSIEWIVWPTKRWRDLDGATLDTVLQPEIVECSVYAVAQHHPAQLTRLLMRVTSKPTRYILDVEGLAELDLDGETAATPFSFSCEIEFTGIVIVPENLFPKPVTPTNLKEVLTDFIAFDGLAEPRHEGFRYLFAPQT